MGSFFKSEAGKLHYFDEGNGFPLLLIHGYLETAEIWSDFSTSLSKEFRIISVDLPGHGLSEVSDKPLTMEFMAAALKGLLDYLGIDKIFFTGHSLGGYIALAFLELFPDRLAGYCLFHSHPFADSPEAIEKREREIKIVMAGKKDLMYPDNVRRMYGEKNREKFSLYLERSRKIASGITAEGIVAVLKGMIARPSRLGLMEEGLVPCLWILGSADDYIPCEVIQRAVKIPQNAELEILKNSGHIGFIEEAEESILILINFIKKSVGK